MSDEFFGVSEQEPQDITTLIKDFDERDKHIIKELITENSDVPIKTIVNAFKKTIEGMTIDIPVEFLRTNFIMATTGTTIRAIKETKPYKFFAVHAKYENYGKGQSRASVFGYMLEEKEIDGKQIIKRCPSLLIRKSDKDEEIINFLKPLKRLTTYNLNISTKGERKLDFTKDYKNPELFWVNEITDFTDVVEGPKSGLTLSSAITQLTRIENPKIKGEFINQIELKSSIENPSSPNSNCGVSEIQPGTKYVDTNDIKMLLVQPTKDSRRSRHGISTSFSAFSVNDPNETIGVFGYEDDSLTRFNANEECLILIGVITKSTSSYSQYNMNLVGLERIAYSKIEKILGL